MFPTVTVCVTVGSVERQTRHTTKGKTVSDTHEIIGTTDDGRHRVILVPDTDSGAPEGDFYGYVFRQDEGYGPAELAGKACATPADDFGLAGAWSHFHDMALVERYARMFRGAVGFDYFDTRDARYVNVVTLDDLKLWGWDSPADYRAGTGNADPSAGNLVEWEAWTSGDVYGYVVQRRVTWTTDDDDFPDHDAWEDTGESCFGFYGYDYAVESAREALASV